MISVDTNILARFYCDDPEDTEAKRQRPAARGAPGDGGISVAVRATDRGA